MEIKIIGSSSKLFLVVSYSLAFEGFEKCFACYLCNVRVMWRINVLREFNQKEILYFASITFIELIPFCIFLLLSILLPAKYNRYPFSFEYTIFVNKREKLSYCCGKRKEEDEDFPNAEKSGKFFYISCCLEMENYVHLRDYNFHPYFLFCFCFLLFRIIH